MKHPVTGALVALAFAMSGIPATLLEAASVARGSTAMSSALLLHEPDLHSRNKRITALLPAVAFGSWVKIPLVDCSPA